MNHPLNDLIIVIPCLALVGFALLAWRRREH